MLAQYIFTRILRRALYTQKFDVSENYNHNLEQMVCAHKFNQVNMPSELDARKFSCAKKFKFTVS